MLSNFLAGVWQLMHGGEDCWLRQRTCLNVRPHTRCPRCVGHLKITTKSTERKRRITEQEITKLREYLNKHPSLPMHDLRHEGVSRLFEQGYQIQKVALVSGHRD